MGPRGTRQPELIRAESRDAIAAPQPWQAVMVFDSSTLMDLDALFRGNGGNGKGEITLNLIRKALDIPVIGAAVIPHYVADYEFRDIVRKYDAEDGHYGYREACTKDILRPMEAKDAPPSYRER